MVCVRVSIIVGRRMDMFISIGEVAGIDSWTLNKRSGFVYV
jgi:hypothetical protein